jgi:entericidin B
MALIASAKVAGVFYMTMTNNAVKRVFLAVTLALLPALLAGCETIAGAGQDLSTAGHAVTGTAENAQAN